MSKTLFHYVHHAAFWLEFEGKRALFDPFLEGNPEGIKAEEITADWILLSHAHEDHVGDAFEIARRSNSLIISTAEVCALARSEGCRAHSMHIGGTFVFDFGKLRVVPAFHGSGVAGGHACGFIVNFYGTRLYYAGDTGLFGDMKWLRDVEPFDTAVLPIGGNFTMNPDDAALACEWLSVPSVIPVHYNTWPVIAQNPNNFKMKVEGAGKTKVLLPQPGETIELA